MVRRSKWIIVLLFVLLAADVVALTIMLTVRRSQPVAALGKVMSSGMATIGGPFTLMGADGNTVTDQTYRGRWMLIYFGYTFCPDACPTALSNMSIALEKLGNEANMIQPLFVTVDPKRDTREVMSAYLESFDPRIVGLLGSQAQTDAVTKAYRVYAEPQKKEGDDYLVYHSAYLYLMDPQGKFVDIVEGATAGEELAEKLRQLISKHST